MIQYPVKLYCRFNLKMDYAFNKPVEIYADPLEEHIKDILASSCKPKDIIRVLWLIKPEAILGLTRFAVEHANLFHYIFTHDAFILQRCPHAHFIAHGTSWVCPRTSEEKKFYVTTVVGNKLMTKGHKLRHALWHRQCEIKIPAQLYMGRFGGVANINQNPVLVANKDPMFDAEFHIAIENSRRNHYFTEKIMDCFCTRTVPIYWGCPSIGDFFNMKGILCVHSVDEIINVANSLKPDTYERMYPYVEENYCIAQQYLGWAPRVERKLRELLADESPYMEKGEG